MGSSEREVGVGRKGGGLQETEGGLRQAQELSPQIRKKKGKKSQRRHQEDQIEDEGEI